MIRIPGGKPFVPPISPKETKPEKGPEEKPGAQKPSPPSTIGRGPEMDARGIAVRLAALATEAKEKEIAAEEFERILEEVISLTGISEPESAMEEASRKLQKEIEAELEKIKANKELMEEAQDWQKFSELLTSLNQEQAGAFIELLQTEIRAL